MKIPPLSRRQLIRSSFASAAGLLAAHSVLGQIGQACGLTPAETEGPFYPVEDQVDKDNDLTSVQGHRDFAKGQVVYILGKVTDEACSPVPNALVEIWQACRSGRYHHPGDTSGLALDPDFQYWGRTKTDAQGNYRFKTILPGHYPADANWERPPHIHYKVYARGYFDLTTQMYFQPTCFDFDPAVTPEYIDGLNRADLILQATPAAERNRLVVGFSPAGPGFSKGSKVGDFNITLKRVRG